MNKIILIFLILIVTNNLFSQEKSKKYYFEFNDTVNGFNINIVSYPDENSYYVNNSLISISENNQVTPFHFNGRINWDYEKYSIDKINILKYVEEIGSPFYINSKECEDFFFFDVNYDGTKELFINSGSNYNIYDTSTGEPFNIQTKNLNGKYGVLGYSLYNERGGFILDKDKQEIELWGSNSSVSGSSEKYKFYNGNYYLIESKEWDLHDTDDIPGYEKTVKIKIVEN